MRKRKTLGPLQFKAFKKFAKARENIDFSEPSTCSAVDYAQVITQRYTSGLETYFDAETFELLVFNLFLHEMIVSGFLCDLVSKYDIENKQFFVGSVSAAGLSSSVENFASLKDAKMFFQDLYRTPYGRLAYSFFESLQGTAVVVL